MTKVSNRESEKPSFSMLCGCLWWIRIIMLRRKKLILHNLNVRMFFWGRILIGCIIWMRNFIFDFFELEKVENYLRVLIPIEWKYTTPPPPPPLVRISFVCVYSKKHENSTIKHSYPDQKCFWQTNNLRCKR